MASPPADTAILKNISKAIVTDNAKRSTLQLPDPIISCDSSSWIMPFSRAGNLIIIRAKADTIEGNFILDTGAPGLVLNLTYFRDYPNITTDADDQGGITGSATRGERTSLPMLSLGPLKYHKIEADRINLGHIENTKGIRILGLLGMDLLKQFEMIIDYEKNQIHMHHVTKKDAPGYKNEMLQDTAAYITTSIDITDNKLITYIYMVGKKLSVVVDTGAETNVLDSRLPNKILDNVVITGRVILNGAGSKKVEAVSGNAGNMKIGSQNIHNLPVIITNLEKLCFNYDHCLDGMLGFDFLSMQKIGFNFVKHKMYIWK